MSDRTGQRIGNYRLVRLLGSGSYADVYLGEHILITKPVAIKVLHAHLAQKEQEGFLQEAQTLVRLKHPRIVEILDVGIEYNTPYLIMDFARYGTLRSKHPKGSIVPLATVIDYVKQIAEALQSAHDNRVIHRDLKPENVLVGANNTLLLSDFGIAAIAHQTLSLQNNPYIGTAPYSAPEQIQEKPRPASDQYALGIMVYEWLTGGWPFTGPLWGIISQHLNVTPPPMSQKVSGIPSTVEAVVMQALAKDPHQRFPSIHNFALALEQAYTQIPVTPGTTLLTYRGHTNYLVSSVAWSPDGKCIASADSADTVQVWEATNGNIKLTYRHTGRIESVAWSPNGKSIASASTDNTVQVWDVATGGKVFIYRGHTKIVSSVAWSPDGKFIASGGYDHLHVWEAATGILKFTFNLHHSEPVLSIAWSPDGKFIALAVSSGVQVWDVTNGLLKFTFQEHRWGTVLSIAWSPDGRYIASSNEYYGKIYFDPPTPVIYRSVKIWDATNGSTKLTYTEDHVAMSVVWSPDGKFIASGGYDHTVHVWEAFTGNNILTYTGHENIVSSIAWSPDGKFIASVSNENTVQVWRAI